MSAGGKRLLLLMRSVRYRSEYVNRQVKTEPPSEKRAVFLLVSKKCKVLTDFPFKKRFWSQYLSSKNRQKNVVLSFEKCIIELREGAYNETTPNG